MITYNLKGSHLCIHCVIITTIEVINISVTSKSFFLYPFRFSHHLGLCCYCSYFFQGMVEGDMESCSMSVKLVMQDE